ncbi:hypothetical protein LCGC14_0432660 [marine sediment metagenome]|uniref:Uncharacterized protein n=1 Tax=marine sediment metagenome TaxID=412755 RepID=A0A0F9V9I0_9ZZZZ
MTNQQDNARKLVKQIALYAGSMEMLVAEIKSKCKVTVSDGTLYNFLSNFDERLSEKSATALLLYCQKHRIKITMRELRPHATYFE